MKRIIMLVGILFSLMAVPFTSFANDKTAEEKAAYEEAVSENVKQMLKNSIALDKINAENKTQLLEWLDVKNPPEEAVKAVEKLKALQESQEKDQESMEPYEKAKKTCDKKLNADGANAALENIIRIQKDRLEDQEELKALWKQVDKLLK